MTHIVLRQHQSVRITLATESDDLAYGDGTVIVPTGATGAVLEVFGDAKNPAAYLIEFRLWDQDKFAMATVPAEFVEPRYTPEDEAAFAQYSRRVDDACAEVRALDPDWRGPDYWSGATHSPSSAEWLKHLEDVIAAAQARVKELRGVSATPPAQPTDTGKS